MKNRNLLRRPGLFIGMVGLLCGTCIHPATLAAQTRRTAALDRLVKAASAEGELNFLGGGIEVPEMWAKWEKAMSAKYGINVKLRFTYNPSMPRMASRLMQEFKAGKPATTDVFIGSENHILALWRAGALESVNWTEISPEIPSGAVAPDNVAVAIASREPGVTYNTRLVPKADVPRKLEDLLNPRWKKKVASTPYAAAFDRAAEILGDERVTKFLKELARENLVGLIGCGEEERVISGEFAIHALTCGGGSVRLQKAKGAPVDHTVLEDIPMVGYWYFGVPKHSPRPNMAKLFTVFMLTEEGQRILWEHESYDLHLLKGSQMSSQVLQSLRLKGVEPRTFGVRESIEIERNHPEWRDKFQKILSGQR